MKTQTPLTMVAVLCAMLCAQAAQAVTNIFFNASQTATVIASNITDVTLSSGDYRFTYSRDGYFTGGVGLTNPVGRFFTVFWPNGVQAQATTVVGPGSSAGANIILKRADGKPFDLQSFTGKILLNTAGAGGAFEIMPLLNGNDAFPDPLQYDCSGYGGQSFSYVTALHNYDTYQIHMWGDFALTALTLIDTNPVTPPVANFTIAASVTAVGGGAIGGAGTYPSNTVCTLTATPNAGWGFQKWTENGAQVSTAATYNFTVRSNRTLVASFVPAYTVTTTPSPYYGASTITGAGTYNSNTTVTVRATPASGFQFVNWTDYGTPVSTTTNYTFTATANHAFVANFTPQTQTAIFDFDTGTPPLYVGQPIGSSVLQSNRGVTAAFSVFAGGWSMQSRQTSVIGAPPSFSGNFLYPSTWWSSIQIQFSAPITNLSFDFMTGDVSSEYNTPSTVRVTAYTNSTATPAVGSGTALGQWINSAYPEGHLNFSSATPFTVVTIDIAPVGVVSGLLFADNIVVQRASVAPNLPPLAFGGNFFQLTGQSLAINIADLMWNDYDPEGDPLTFTGVSATTSNGLALTTNATQILVPANALADGFSYTISDGNGGTATGTATISIITSPVSQANSLDLSVPGSAVVNFSGVPWYFYEAQRATNAAFTGTLRLWSVQAASDGSISVWDDFSDLVNKPGQAFYRLRFNQ